MGRAISPAADMWSFGVTLWEMCLRRRFPSRDAMITSRSLVPRWRRTLRKHARHVTNPPVAVRAIIESCLRIDPNARATSEQVFYEFVFLADDVEGRDGEVGPLPSVDEEGEGFGDEVYTDEDEELAGITESLSGANNLSAQRMLNARFLSMERCSHSPSNDAAEAAAGGAGTVEVGAADTETTAMF